MTLPTASAVHATLTRELPNIDAKAVVRALAANGHVANDIESLYAAADVRERLSRVVTPMCAAADRRNLALLKEVAARCARLGYKLDLESDRPVDLLTLDQCFAGKSLDERMIVKSQLAALHLI